MTSAMLACYRQTTGEDGRVWWAWLLGINCAVRGVPEPTSQVERYLVQVSASVEPVGDVPEDIAGALGPWSANLELRLTKEPSRAFRDESMGALIQFEAASLVVAQPDEDPRPVPLDLVGRVIEIRTFEDGEILDIGWAGRTAGMGRYLDVFDLVFPAISLAVPPLREDETARRRIIWPTPVGRTAPRARRSSRFAPAA